MAASTDQDVHSELDSLNSSQSASTSTTARKKSVRHCGALRLNTRGWGCERQLHDCMRLRGCCGTATPRYGGTSGVAQRAAEFRSAGRDVGAPCALRRGVLAPQLPSRQRVGLSAAPRLRSMTKELV
jgi:hypothetical protein